MNTFYYYCYCYYDYFLLVSGLKHTALLLMAAFRIGAELSYRSLSYGVKGIRAAQTSQREKAPHKSVCVVREPTALDD